MRAPLLALVAAAALLPSCTLAGGAIGSTVPNYTPATVEDAREGSVNIGERVAVVRASDGERIVGKFRGVSAVGVNVETGGSVVTIEPSDVRSLSVARGNYWLEGGTAGLAADVVIAVVVGTRIARAAPDTSSVGNIHVGSDGVTVGAR